MARLDAKWNNFSLRGQAWDHFWQDAASSSSVILSGNATVSFSASGAIQGVSSLTGTSAIIFDGTAVGQMIGRMVGVSNLVFNATLNSTPPGPGGRRPNTLILGNIITIR